MKILVYSAEFGNYEHKILEPICPDYDPNVTKTYLRFSKNLPSENSLWSGHYPYLNIDQEIPNTQYQARYYKTDPDKTLHDEEFDYTIWVDANMKLLVDPTVLVDLLGDNDLMTFRHRDRTTIEQEGQTVIKIKAQEPARIARQLVAYRKAGYKDQVPLPETGLTIRKCNDKVRAFNALWWENIKEYCVRDQMSFGFSAWQAGLKVGFFPGHVRSMKYNLLYSHRRNK